MSMSDDLKINFDKVGKACKQVGEEWEKMMRENNPFDTISKIAKDIADRQDKEMALEFTKCIGELLKKNGVKPMIDEYRHETVEENFIGCRYGVAITGLDFTEHDKKFKDEITQLKHDTKKMEDKIAELEDKINNLRARCRKSAIDAFNNGNYGFLYIVTADELKNDELPNNPMEAVQMLINSTYERETNSIERALYKCGDSETAQRYSINDLEQIAEHLLVYCKHHRDEED